MAPPGASGDAPTYAGRSFPRTRTRTQFRASGGQVLTRDPTGDPVVRPLGAVRQGGNPHPGFLICGVTWAGGKDSVSPSHDGT